MSQPPPLSPQLISHLKAEAHAKLCRQSCEQALAGVEEERQKLQGTRPVFAFLSSSKTKANFESSEQELAQTERQVRERLEVVDRIDIWVRSEIRQGLENYLLTASLEYQTLERLPLVLNRWRRGVGQLSESVLAVAREIKALSEQVSASPGGSSLGYFTPLQSAVLGLERRVHEVNAAAHDFAQLKQGRLSENIALPALPPLPESTWIDRLMVRGLAACADQFQPAEAAAREFCRTGVRKMLDDSLPIDEHCVSAKTVYLEHYWEQLRAHTLKHLSGVGDTDTVLVELEKRMLTEQRMRQQDALTRSPFAIAR